MAYTSAQLVAAYTAANGGVVPDAATTALLTAFATQTQTGQLSDSAALAYVLNSADNDVNVAVQAYQFFTGKTPSQAGLNYLVNSTTNTTDLNDPYYTQFNLENRYLNFAVNLGVVGEGAAAFNTAYGAMNFNTFVGVAYETIIGSSYAQAAGINVAAAIADITSRKAAFEATARQAGVINSSSTTAQVDIATKAALIGYLMAEGIKADVGLYAAGANNFVQALVNGNPQYNVNLVTTYSVLGGGIGTPGGGPVAGGSNLSLTLATDALTGTSGNDTFTGDTGLAGGSSVQASDSLNGGGGTDTFLYYAPAAAPVMPQLNSIEVIKFAASTAATAIDLSGNTALTQVWVKDTSTTTGTITLAPGVTAGLEGVTGAATATFDFGNLASTTVANATISNGNAATKTTGTLNLDGTSITTINLTSSGAAKNTIGALASTGKEGTVNISGGTALTITGALSTDTKTVNASANSGGVTITTGATSGTITGGTGADTFNVGSITGTATVNLGAGNDTVQIGGTAIAATSNFDGGDGTDTFQLTTGGNLTSTTAAQIKNFEVLATGAGKGTYDSSLISGVTSVVVDGDLAAATSITNLASGSGLVSITADQASSKVLTLALKDASGTSDSLTVKVGGDVNVTGVNILTTGIETLTVNSSKLATNTVASPANTIALLDITGTKSLVITGDVKTTLTATANDGSLTTVDASGTTKGFIMGAAVVGTQSVTFLGGTGADTFIGNGTAGPGGDTYRGGTGGDTLTPAAAGKVDTFIYTAATDSQITATSTLGMDVIGANFTVNQDVIDLLAFGFSGTQRAVKSLGALTAVSGVTSVTDMFDVAGVDRAVAFGTNGGNTYVYVDVNKDGNYTAANDLIIQITGTPALTNAEFLF